MVVSGTRPGAPAVEDRGPGIPEHERHHIFERFARGESSSGPEPVRGRASACRWWPSTPASTTARCGLSTGPAAAPGSWWNSRWWSSDRGRFRTDAGEDRLVRARGPGGAPRGGSTSGGGSRGGAGGGRRAGRLRHPPRRQRHPGGAGFGPVRSPGPVAVGDGDDPAVLPDGEGDPLPRPGGAAGAGPARAAGPGVGGVGAGGPGHRPRSSTRVNSGCERPSSPRRGWSAPAGSAAGSPPSTSASRSPRSPGGTRSSPWPRSSPP